MMLPYQQHDTSATNILIEVTSVLVIVERAFILALALPLSIAIGI